jgi:quercetin dioxygenase-like cupin family protein
VTTIAPHQRAAVGRHRRELEVILASAPAGAAVVVSCTVPAATCGPPLHAHATSDETLYVLSGVLLVRDDARVAAIPEGGMVHIGPGTPHTFATTPGAAALPHPAHQIPPWRRAGAMAHEPGEVRCPT